MLASAGSRSRFGGMKDQDDRSSIQIQGRRGRVFGEAKLAARFRKGMRFGSRGRRFRLRRLSSNYLRTLINWHQQALPVGRASCLGTGAEPNSWLEARAVTRLGGSRCPGTVRPSSPVPAEGRLHYACVRSCGVVLCGAFGCQHQPVRGKPHAG